MTTAMTGTDTGLPLPSGSRVGIVAGGGRLPAEVADKLRSRGHDPFVVVAEGETDPAGELEKHDHVSLPLERFGSLVPVLKRHRVSHLVLAGEIKRRPKLTRLRPSAGLLAMLPSLAALLARGDDGLLRGVVRYIEKRGIKVVGAHEIVPELLADEGLMTTASPTGSDWRDIEAARIAAETIGALDIGQGAVAIGGRAIALEGIEGTDGLLERVKGMRDHGRLAGKTRGVLVKCAKPGQEVRADLPAIGLRTVELAHAAGLAGIGVEAGHTLVLEGPPMIARANALGMFVIGIPPKDET